MDVLSWKTEKGLEQVIEMTQDKPVTLLVNNVGI